MSILTVVVPFHGPSGRFAFMQGAVIVAVTLAVGCRSEGDHGHHNGDAHGHGHGHASPGADPHERESLGITVWTNEHELFVEFPPPVPNQPLRYHVHVTRISDNRPATTGRFTVRFKAAAGGTVTETSIDGVARAGIFTPEGKAPAAGSYQLEMVYTVDGNTDVFDCGMVVVANGPPARAKESGAISFLKESQWKIPFATAWADERPMAKEIELAATIEPAASKQLTIAAATGGRFFHHPKLALAEGLRIDKGDVVGSIAPTVAGDDFSRLQFAVEDARLAKQQTQSEIKRIKPLIDEGVLPRKRLIALEYELKRNGALLKSTRRRLGRVVAPGGAGGLAIKSTLKGVVAQVFVSNGEPVEAGAPLLRLRGTDHVWLRARFVARPASDFVAARPAAVRLPSGERIDLSDGSGRFLSSLPVIDPVSRIATWVVDVAHLAPTGDYSDKWRSNLLIGSSAVLSVRIGKPRTVLAVPISAVIEINTRPYVFVQVDGESFNKRAVTLGDRDGDFVRVLSGIDRGDRIVTVGGFDVHLASFMGAVESHRH